MTFNNQIEMFNWIWDNRPHVSEFTGEILLGKNDPRFYWQFAHVLSKGAYPAFKLKEFNIMLALPDEHQNQERYPKFVERKALLIPRYYEEIVGKKF